MKDILKPVLLIFFISIIFQGCGGSGADTQNYQDPALSKYDIDSQLLVFSEASPTTQLR